VLVVFGARGFLGKHVLDAAAVAGVPVRAVTRGPLPISDGTSVHWASVDSRSPESVRGLIAEGDTVVNLAYHNDADENLFFLANLLQSCVRENARRLIHCSTATVVGLTPRRLITEATSCSPIGPYETVKERLERRIIEASQNGLDSIILRPTAIVGPQGSNLRSLAESLLHGSAAINYMRASLFGDRPMHLVPATTVAAAILHVAGLPRRYAGETFIVSADDDPDNRFSTVERILAAALGLQSRRVRPLPLPRVILSSILRVRGDSDPALDRIYSSEKLLSSGFQPVETISKAVSEYGAWFRHARP
jgi:nucleoside-diphosphate-sugar epimerase